MKFSKWLGTTVSMDILYDDDVLKKTQMKEFLGMGRTEKLWHGRKTTHVFCIFRVLSTLMRDNSFPGKTVLTN